MSHLRPEDKAARHRVRACRRGRHDYGEPQLIGGGILRQICTNCSDVSIDLTGADEVSQTAIVRRPSLANFRR